MFYPVFLTNCGSVKPDLLCYAVGSQNISQIVFILAVFDLRANVKIIRIASDPNVQALRRGLKVNWSSIREIGEAKTDQKHKHLSSLTSLSTHLVWFWIFFVRYNG